MFAHSTRLQSGTVSRLTAPKTYPIMRFPLMIAVLATLAGFAIGQETAEPEADDTLPPVIVEPDESPVEAEEPEPDFDDVPPDVDAGVDLSPVYPSLSDLRFEDLSGILRAERSIFDEPRAVSIIPQQELIERAPIDMGQALERETGVMIQRTGRGQSSPFIRGLTGQQVLILVDGIRMSNATFRAGPNQYFNTVDPGQVERIEVIRGPASVLYGSDAIGGVINIVTKGAQYRGSDFAEGGTVQRFRTADLGYYGRVNIEGWVGSSGVFAGGGYGNFNNLDRGGTLGRQPDTSWFQHSGDVKFTQRLGRYSELIVAVQHFAQQDLFRTDRFPSNRETIFDPQQRDLGYVRWQGVVHNSFIDRYTVTSSFHRTLEDRLDRNPRNSPRQDQRRFTDEQTGVNVLFSSSLGSYGRLDYGFDWYHEDVDSTRRRVDSSIDPPTVTPSSSTQFPDDAYYSRYGAFLQWDYDVTERLNAVSGVRYSFVEAGATVTAGNLTGPIKPNYRDWTYTAGLTYALTDTFRLVSSVSEGFRAPNLDDLTALNNNVFAGIQVPNPDLRPEQATSYEVGAKWSGDRVRAQAFVYWMEIQDNLLRQDQPGPDVVFATENRDSFVQGVEFNGELLLGCGWSTYGNLFYTFGKDRVGQEPLSRIPPTQGTVGLRWRSQRGGCWFETFLWLVNDQSRLSQRDRLDVNRIPAGGTPGYGTLNFRLGQRIGRNQRIALNLENATDRAFRVHGSGPDGPGINLTMTYQWLH